MDNTIDEISEELKQVYKEILNNSLYVIGTDNPRKLNINDINIFYKAITLLFKLKEEYKNTLENRALLGNQISKLAKELKVLSYYIDEDIEKMASNYYETSRLYISDFEKIINIFASLIDSDFTLKKVYVTGLASLETKHGIREDTNLVSKVYLIGDKEFLDTIEDNKIFDEYTLKNITRKLLQLNKSLIIATNYYFDANILPNSNNGITIQGNSNIYCYLKKDSLNKIVENFLLYAKNNGNRINDINEEDIINSLKSKDKIKVKGLN